MADFYRPAPGLALDDLAERIAARVVDMYSAVEAELLAQVARRLSRGLPAVPELDAQLAVIRELQATARRLLGKIPPDLAQQIVQIAIERGTAAAADQLALTVDIPKVSNITRTHADTLALVAQDLGNAFDQVALRILRYPIDALGAFIGTDAYQQTIARHTGLRTVGNMSTDEVRRRALTDFLDQGITGFTDRLGRRWRIGSYTEMAVRSATARAYTDASTARQLRAGYRLVTVLGNNDACRLCGAWFGKVLSIDGTPAGTYQMEHAIEDGVYVEVEVAATLDDARRQGLMHPNCACTTAGYLPGLTKRVSAAQYDPEAEGFRERQRHLERKIRDFKRKGAIAEAVGDSDRAQKMAAKVRAAQGELRALVAESGQKRRYDREQPRWADGPSGRPAQPNVAPVVPGRPPGAMAENPVRASLGLEPAEDGTVTRLTRQ